jgi:hypothetical protein
MVLTEQVTEMINAGCPAIWVNSDEHDDAVSSLTAANSCVVNGEERQPWKLFTWDANSGLKIPGQAVEHDDLQDNSCKAALKTVCAVAADAVASEQQCHVVLVIRNGHLHVGKNIDLLQTICDGGWAGVGVCIVVLSYSGIQVPRELSSTFRLVGHELPAREERRALILQVCDDAGCKEGDDHYPDDESLEDLVDATGGNTRLAIITDCGICFARLGRLDLRTLFELKADNLVESTAIRLMDTDKKFDDLGGLSGLKDDLLRRVPLLKALRNKDLPRADREAIPTGCLLVSIAGSGKTHLANALANEVGLPGLELEVTALLGSFVGQSEENTRKAMAVFRAMSPCVVFVDEIEKVLGRPGNAGSKEGDGGVRSGLTALFLKEMQNTKGVYWIFAANSAENLHPALLRAERLDDKYFIDLPSREAKDKIWEIYTELFDLHDDELWGERPDDSLWTGAEIRSCCRKARMDKKELKLVAQSIQPEAKQSEEDLTEARKWALASAVDADTGVSYAGPNKSSDGRRESLLENSKAPRRAVRRKTKEV